MLVKSHVGCYMNKVLIKHLFDADDLVLIAFPPAAPQIPINSCQAAAQKKPKSLNNLHVPPIYLNEKPSQMGYELEVSRGLLF